MKALNLSAFIVFFIIFLGNVNSQTAKTSITLDEPFYIYCNPDDEVPSDLLSGSWTFNLMQHSSKKNGIYWEKINSAGTNYISEWTGEVFREVFVYQYNEMKTSSNKIVMHRNWRLLGNMGSHYICSFIAEIDPETGDFIFLQHNHKCL